MLRAAPNYHKTESRTASMICTLPAASSGWRTSIRLAGCALSQGAAEPPHCEPGSRDRRWRSYQRRPGHPGLRRRGQRRRGVPVAAPASSETAKSQAGPVSHWRCPRRTQERPQSGLDWSKLERCRVHFMRNLLAHIPQPRQSDGDRGGAQLRLTAKTSLASGCQSVP